MLDLVFVRIEVLDARGNSNSNQGTGSGTTLEGGGGGAAGGAGAGEEVGPLKGRGFVGAYTTSVERLLPGSLSFSLSAFCLRATSDFSLATLVRL